MARTRKSRLLDDISDAGSTSTDPLNTIGSSSDDDDDQDEADAPRDVYEEDESHEHRNDESPDEEESETVIAASDPVQTKRKGRKRKRVEAEDDTVVKIIIKKITYDITILSATEMAKPATQRVPLASHVQLDSSEPWDAVKAQLLVKISDALNPSPLLFSNYSATYTIIRIVPKPGYSLIDDTTYNFMIERALLAKNPTVNLVIVSKPTAPDAILAVSQKAIADEASKLAAKPGKKARKDPATLPGNVEKGKLIEELRERWSCGQGGCMGNHCYVDPANVHHPLSHERFDVWASAMLKHDGTATLESPPNHKCFDSTLSPVLQRRKAAFQNTAASPSSQPVFNISFPPDMLGFLRPAPAAAANPPPAVLPPAALLSPYQSPSKESLVLKSRLPGPLMSIEDFCLQYELEDQVLTKLLHNGYTSTRTLRHIRISELKEMDFKFGEIAELKEAVHVWSTLRPL